MPTNKRSKYRGSRTCGGGTHKNRRGAGNRGGRGRAGINAHHFVKWYMEMGGPVFGKNGFFHNPAVTVSSMDVGIIDQIVPCSCPGNRQTGRRCNRLKRCRYRYREGTGQRQGNKEVNISATAFSEEAKAKIEKTGGKARSSDPPDFW